MNAATIAQALAGSHIRDEIRRKDSAQLGRDLAAIRAAGDRRPQEIIVGGQT